MKRLYTFLITGTLIVITAGIFFVFNPYRSDAKNIIAPKRVQKSIKIIPLGDNIPEAFIRSVQGEVEKFLPDVNLEPVSPLPSFAYNKVKNRYRADSIIHWLSRRANANEIYLAITNVDISTTKGEIKDWGVMGLGFQPGKAAIASNFRMKNKTDFWKVAIHELGHTSGLPHCPEKTCFMRDANGGNPTREEKSFCKNCELALKKIGWQL